jgi:hypothetical protein
MIEMRSGSTSILVLALLLAPVPAWGQEKKSAPPAKKEAAEASCDGALEIVPSQAMTFTRKRRPGKARSAPPASEAKPEKKPAGASS